MATASRRRQVPASVGAAAFLRETFEEMRKVSWPTPAELYRYTLVVLLTVAVLAAFVGLVDQGFLALTQKFIYGL